MPCYTFYVFNRKGACQYYHEWSRGGRQAGDGAQPENLKLVFGQLWACKSMATSLDPKRTSQRAAGAPSRIGEGSVFRSFATANFKLHFLESPTGLKFVMLTDPAVGDLSQQLSVIYASLFVPHVVKNPLYTPGDAFLFEPFSSGLNKYVRSLGLAD